MAGIQLDDATMRDVVTAAIIKTLTAESREILIRDAVASLLLPSDKSGGYNADKRTKLQVCFEDAVQGVAREEVMRALKEDGPVREKVRELMLKGLEKAIEDASVVDNIAFALAKAFASQSRY